MKFKSPLTLLDRLYYIDGLNCEPVFWNRCIIDIPKYKPGNLTMWRFVFDAKQNLN